MSETHSHVVPPLAPRSELCLTRDGLITWGEEFGKAAVPPLVVGLSGELGSGKTTLAQAICAGFGVTEEVTSPTYALVHRYAGTLGPVFHLDLYRLTGPEQLTNIGWDEIVASPALVLVEWPERAGDRWPHDGVCLQLAYAPQNPDCRVLLAG